MKRSFVLLLLVLSCFGLRAQNYKVTYRHCVQTDTSRTITDTIGIEAELIAGEHSSNYTYLRQTKATSSNYAPVPQRSTDSQTFVIKRGTPVDSIGNMVYYDKVHDSVWVRDKISSGYVIVTEQRPLIRWLITDERKMIQNFSCQKATATFRGRNYTAWFTSDLPIAEGPWKFKGLPGLILSVEDDKRQVKIYAVKVEYPVATAVPLFIPEGRLITPAQHVIIRNEELHRTGEQLREQIASDPRFKKATVNTSSALAGKGFFSIEKSLD